MHGVGVNEASCSACRSLHGCAAAWTRLALKTPGLLRVAQDLLNLSGQCRAEIQQLALIGSSSSLRSKACNASGASDGVIHSSISLEAACSRVAAKRKLGASAYGRLVVDCADALALVLFALLCALRLSACCRGVFVIMRYVGAGTAAQRDFIPSAMSISEARDLRTWRIFSQAHRSWPSQLPPNNAPILRILAFY